MRVNSAWEERQVHRDHRGSAESTGSERQSSKRKVQSSVRPQQVTMRVMKRVRPVWAVVAAASAVVVLASVAGSVATGMGWWTWGSRNRHQLILETTVRTEETRYEVDRGGIYCGFLIGTRARGTPHLATLLFAPTPTAWFPWVLWSSGRLEFAVPFWLISIFGLVCASAAWRRMMRPRPGCCSQCGYSLAGLESELCPECGTASQAEASAEPPRSGGGAGARPEHNDSRLPRPGQMRSRQTQSGTGA